MSNTQLKAKSTENAPVTLPRSAVRWCCMRVSIHVSADWLVAQVYQRMVTLRAEGVTV
jgi:hypothetical protein